MPSIKEQGKEKPESRTKAAAARPPSSPPARRATTAAATPVEATLARVLSLAEALMRDNKESRGALPSGRTAPAEAPSDVAVPDEPKPSARERLATALSGLEPEMAIKLRTLMIAGRDGQSIGTVKVNLSMSDADSGFATMAADSSENGPLLIDYLRRGHALACASGIDLDGPLARWQSSPAPDLGERAWLSFGRQLASSQPADWQCLGLVEQPTQELSMLYLRLREHGWWSFRSVLDRPTPAGVEKERRALAKRRLKGISSDTLEAIVGRFAGAQGRALQRAGRAICARLGHVAA
jgi:hypothetical protein